LKWFDPGVDGNWGKSEFCTEGIHNTVPLFFYDIHEDLLLRPVLLI
jgi:hypothetical protein